MPHPFYEEGWPGATRAAAQALWDWHLSLWHPSLPEREQGRPDALFEAERARAAAGEPVRIVPEEVTRAAYAACERHRLPRTLLAEQVGAARRLHGGALRFPTYGSLRDFMRQGPIAHARLLAGLADAGHSWQLPYVDELGKAFFIVGRLMRLPEDLERDWLFFPESDLAHAGVTLEELRAGQVDERVRRLLWKQSIRARDAFAQGLPLADEVAPRTARALTRWGFGGLEVLNEIERRDYDLWSRPLRLSLRHRIQVRFQARFGRTTFRKR